MSEDREKGELIKKGLTIIDELGKIDTDYPLDEEDLAKIFDLIEQAQKLKRHRLWKLR